MANYGEISKKIFTRTLHSHALSTYTRTYAKSYRSSDDTYYSSSHDTGKFAFVQKVSSSYHAPAVLDMGCGTGRYFHCYNNAQSVVGFDLSRPMLLEAKNPVGGIRNSITLINSSLTEIEFRRSSFDVVICMGMFGGISPLEESIVCKVSGWLKPGGCFCFDVIERWLVAPTPGTWRSRVADKMRPYLFGPAKAYIDARLMQFTVSRSNLHSFLCPYFNEVQISDSIGASGKRVDLLCTATLSCRP